MASEGKTLNINSIFLVIVIGLAGWTLHTVQQLAVDQNADNRDILQLRERIATVEKDVVTLRVRFAGELGLPGRGPVGPAPAAAADNSRGR